MEFRNILGPQNQDLARPWRFSTKAYDSRLQPLKDVLASDLVYDRAGLGHWVRALGGQDLNTDVGGLVFSVS